MKKIKKDNNSKCNLSFELIPKANKAQQKKLGIYIDPIYICEGNTSLICNGTFKEFETCKLKECINKQEKILKVYKDFFKVRKLKENEKWKEEL